MTASGCHAALTARLHAELATPLDPAAQAGAQALAGMGRVLAVLYYGSTLRAPDPEGILDFYVVVARVSDWPGTVAVRIGQHVLPPNVGYLEYRAQGRVWRAKYAVITMAQCSARSRVRSYDTSIWARFCQPVRLGYVRDAEVADRILAMVRSCVLTASVWAHRLGPAEGTAVAFWQALLRRTYDAELRVEKPDRAHQLLVGPLAARAAAILPEAWDAAGIAAEIVTGRDGDMLRPEPAPHREARRRWARIRARGRARNVARLAKAAFTFEGAADYVAWKIARHTGFALNLGPFARRHPLLALPFVLPRIRRAFAARRG